ncbi:translocation/assembly module TamB domain-containing protein [Myxococcus sp. Y35]|uniref:translocation/assembly module TamB domain-containing protein n=1 Tax=Pseudomyxococcus flavus TaxID=3115648 RepID=UPI003CEC75CC
MTESTSTAPPPSPRRPARWGRRVLWGLLGLVGLVVLLVAGVLVFATTPSGEAWLVEKGLAIANEQFSGRLELGRLDLSLGGVVLEDVKLYDPEGELVAEIARVDVRARLVGLARQHVDLPSARIERPRLYLAQDERGLNLARALEPRKPNPEQPSSGRGALVLDLRELVLEDGHVDFRQELPEGGERQVRLEDLDARGSARYAAATLGVSANLDATARLALPVAGPVKLNVKASGEEGAFQGDVGLEAAGLVLDASGSAKLPPETPPGTPAGPLHASLELRRLSAPPELLRAFVPTWPLVVPVSAEGTAGLDGDEARVDLTAKAASATLTAKGDLNLERMQTRGLSVKARDVDLSQLMAQGPTTRISADLDAKGGGTSLESLEGEVKLTVSPSEYLGQPLGPVELEASAKEGRYSLMRLRMLAPGVALQARGEGTSESVQLEGGLTAGNLALLSQMLAKLLPGTVAPMAGNGTLDFAVKGPLRTPAVTVDGGFATLRYGDVAAQDLTVKLEMPDVTQPLTTDATLVVSRLRAGGRDLRDVAVTLATHERALDASVRVQGDAELALTLQGEVDANGQGLGIQQLALSWPEATWTLQRPTHVAFGGGNVEVTPPLVLASQGQTLSLQGALRGQRVTARVELGAFDLSRLPAAFVPQSLGLGGTLTGHVAASGRRSRPDAEADLRLEDGRARGYEGLQAELKARYVKDRATGTLTAGLPVARLAAEFDVPVQGVLKRRRDAMSLRVNLEDLDVAGTMKLAGRPEGASGRLTGTLSVEGPAREPLLDFTLRGQDVRYQTPPPGFSLAQALAFELRAASNREDQSLAARLDVQGLGPRTYVALKTPFTLGGLLAKPPTPDEIFATTLGVEARVTELPLTLLQGMSGVQQPGGTVTAQLDFEGSVLVPQATLRVKANAVTVNDLPPMNGQLDVVGGERDVKLTLAAQRQNGPLAQLTATLDAPLGALQDQEVYGHIPFDITGRVGPVPLQELPGVAPPPSPVAQGTPPPQGGRPKGIQGVLAMELGARGTLDTPQVELTAGVQGLGMGSTGLGQVRLNYAYKDTRSRFDLLLTEPGGGTLLVNGGLGLDVSLPAITRGLQTDNAPVEVALKARNFNPSFLSGTVEMLRSIGGVLQADASLAGTLGAPSFNGSLEWKDGNLGLMGLGEYRDIQLALKASQESIALTTLAAKAGNGSLKLDSPLTAVRNPRGEYELSSPGSSAPPLVMRNFPIIVDDQLMALVSLRGKVEGTVSQRLINLRNIAIPEATIELPEAKRKDLQALERPGDVVLVRNGEPLDRKKRKEAQTPPTPNPDAAPADGAPPAEGVADVGSEAETQPLVVWMNVNAPRNLWVKGSDINAELGLSEDFRVEYTDVARLFGEVRVLRGRVDVLGRRFDIQRDSQVRFTGPPMTPYINVTAEHRNESAKVTVFVTIRGQGREITLKPTSDPPLPESEIYTLLATGRRTLDRGSGASMNASAQAASVVGSLVANEARKALAAKLPLDVVSIEAGESGIAGTKLEVGTYVTDKIYVGYTGRVGANLQQGENANAVRFEYQLGTRWSLEGQYGDARSGGLDLIWTNQY